MKYQNSILGNDLKENLLILEKANSKVFGQKRNSTQVFLISNLIFILISLVQRVCDVCWHAIIQMYIIMFILRCINAEGKKICATIEN